MPCWNCVHRTGMQGAQAIPVFRKTWYVQNWHNAQWFDQTARMHEHKRKHIQQVGYEFVRTSTAIASSGPRRIHSTCSLDVPAPVARGTHSVTSLHGRKHQLRHKSKKNQDTINNRWLPLLSRTDPDMIVTATHAHRHLHNVNKWCLVWIIYITLQPCAVILSTNRLLLYIVKPSLICILNLGLHFNLEFSKA